MFSVNKIPVFRPGKAPLTTGRHRVRISTHANVVELGSEGSAARGRRSELSEWPGSACNAGVRGKAHAGHPNRGAKGALPEAEEATRASGRGRPTTQAFAPRRGSGTATGRHTHKLICGCGGIGRLIGFRFQRASVQVRVLSSAPINKRELLLNVIKLVTLCDRESQ